MEASSRQLRCLKELLETFGESSGLQDNFAKSCLVPINVDATLASHLAEEFMPIIDQMEKHLMLFDSLFQRRLQMVKSMLTACPWVHLDHECS